MGFGNVISSFGQVIGGSIAASSQPGRIIFTALQRARTKKEIQEIYNNAHDTNFQNRSVGVLSGADKQQLLLISGDPSDNDIYDYEPASSTPAIDYIWGETDGPESSVVSGGQNNERVRALMPFVNKSQQEDTPLIALHSGNHELETMINGNSSACELISRGSFYYDAFRGMPVEDMAHLLYETMPDDNASPAAEALLHSLLEVLLRVEGTVTFQNLAAFPLPDLNNKLDAMQKAGELTSDEYREINRYYMSGSPEIDSVRIFLNKLNRQAEGIYGRPASKVCNIKKMLNCKGAIAVDVGNVNNDLFFSLVVNHLMLLQSQGRSFSILLDGIPVSRFPKVNDLLRGRVYAISHNDFVSSLFGGGLRGEDLFSEITGNIGAIVLFRHTSGTSCQKWSDHLGKYHKIRIKHNISQTSGFMNPGDSRGLWVDETDEPRVRAETLAKLPGTFACIHKPGGTLFAEV
ncbi:MAG: hypothetical protein LBK66_11635 [Spirochaetaceae bacterium]|jgi:hypothetical protein|nr:hypothetical protein [Spirochaetaceae bacterium]